ncbi:MAG: hypothetical protein WC552_04665 [Candidatus Omnitrophota bacterium]
MDITVKGFTKISSILSDYIRFELHLEDRAGAKHSIKIDCSQTVAEIWKMESETLIQRLYQVIRKDLCDIIEFEKVRDIRQFYPLTYNTYNTPAFPPEMKYALPDRIQAEPRLFKSAVEHFSAKPIEKKEKRRISSLGEHIAGLRDSINAIAKAKWGFTLLEIKQERPLVTLYLSCHCQDEFADRMSALLSLVSWINKDATNALLKEPVLESEGTKYHLEKFMEQEFPYPDKENTFGKFEDLQGILNKFMTYKDSEEVLNSFAELGIPRPSEEDYSETWEAILYKYCSFLKSLLALLQTNERNISLE